MLEESLPGIDEEGIRKKRNIALTSVAAAVFLTIFKLIVGVATGSLGILSEALHSGLDLVAAIITFFAVRFADLPPDKEHNFGHGKIENFSALIETLLLFITCGWIIYEAAHRLITGKVDIEISVWSYIVVITSIVVDFSRSRALLKVARKYNSQALEADALHFSTDILSSLVVLGGIIFATFNFNFADPIAALLVAGIVLSVSYRLGKRSFDVLVDRAPEGDNDTIREVMFTIPEVVSYHDVRIREAGANKFIELNIHVNKMMTISRAHEISHVVEREIKKVIPNCKIIVHAEPDS